METTIQQHPTAKIIISEVLTLEEVSNYLRLPIESVRNHAVQGFLPGNQMQGEWRFLKPAIDRWLMPKDKLKQDVKQDFQAAQSNNDEILALLASWDTEDQEEHQTKIWNHLKFALENRDGFCERATQS